VYRPIVELQDGKLGVPLWLCGAAAAVRAELALEPVEDGARAELFHRRDATCRRDQRLPVVPNIRFRLEAMIREGSRRAHL
jgi:hypothetical protein